MKQFLVISLLFLAKMVAAQNIAIGIDPSDLEKTTFEKAIIHFKDGTDIEGIGRLKTIFTSKEEVIIFKIEEKDKDETWTYKDASGITIISDDEIKHYEYLKVTKNSYAELYEVVTEGNVKLYKKIKTYSKNPAKLVVPTIAANAPGGMNNIKNGYENPDDDTSLKNASFYVQRENEPYPTKIRDNYIKSFAEYMKDCDVAVEKIKNHEYNFGQLKDLVDYYNANCGE
jgi:hypothetical protein